MWGEHRSRAAETEARAVAVVHVWWPGEGEGMRKFGFGLWGEGTSFSLGGVP